MFIKEIIIDGFKSYQYKTSVGPFDRYFNAITGLNGSGKSNILDAICFVLGMTTLSNVRAANLQELIYKYGNAGIAKASVTVVFDNSDKKTSPIGCEAYDEVTVTRTIYQGKSKYYLNGYTATQDNIKSVYHSVQLNINNPHFLIMQGKVTQVVNMKPIEILGLLEEAAGTSIYEMKKESSIKVIKKKNNKLEEINKILSEEISPQLEKLIKDKENFMTWKAREGEIDKLFKYVTANEYMECLSHINGKNDELVQLKSQENDLRVGINELVYKVEQVIKKIIAGEDKINNSDNARIKESELKLKDARNKVKELTHERENIIKTIEGSKKEINKIEQKINKNEISYENSEKQKKDLASTVEILEKELDSKTAFLKEMERTLENINQGKGGDLSKESHNFQKQINEIKNNINNHKGESKNLKNQNTFLEEEINKKKNYLSEFKKSTNDNKKNSSSIEKQIEKLSKELESLEFNPSKNDQIQREIQDKELELKKFETKQNEILNQHSWKLETSFRDPENHFDRSKVKGKVIKLFTIENERFATALEFLAGAKLYNVVVDNDNTSRLLLQRKCFDSKVFIIPLNKITSKQMSENQMKAIYDTFGNEAKLALDLIKYDKKYEPAMQYIFGSTFVCSTTEICKRITFNKSMGYRCVNMEGDIFEPQGTMSGGSYANKDNIIIKAQELNFFQSKIQEIKLTIVNLKNQLGEINDTNVKFNDLRSKIDNLNIQFESMNEEAMSKKIATYENDILKHQEDKKRNDERITQLEKQEKKYVEEIKILEKELQEFKSGNNTNMHKNKIKSLKEAIVDIEKNLKKSSKALTDLEFQVKDYEDDLKKNNELLQGEIESMESNKKEITNIEGKIQQEKLNQKRLEAENLDLRSEQNKNEGEMKALKEEKGILEKKNEDLNSELKKIENKLGKFNKDLKESEYKKSKLEKENKWIETEKDFFGQPNSDYDFSKFDEKKETEKLSKMREENNVLKRKVNMKVDLLADQYENEYKSLVEKREIIIKDKNNIEKAILELDIKRKDALEDIFTHVNVNLNSIYSTLLPGTKAKLSILEGKTLMDGLELKVAFNNHWKKSLSELSGGQRSLLALSLILALLKYKPAPFYILDEIDAALDLSHTQNLGIMIKDHFPQSQFIVVSLKDGMFNNANVLFQVQFIDGASKVERTAKDKKKLK